MVPDDGDEMWPTLGPQVCDWIETFLVFGPGDLRGEPAVLDDEKRALIYRMYEVYPDDHEQAGRRRFKRAGISVPKGLAKTECAAWITAAELHHDSPVRCVGWSNGIPIGGPVVDPYIPMMAFTEEQSDELAYGALRSILGESPLANDFDIGLERVMRIRGDGKAVSLANSPSARDGARTTFQLFDEPLALDTPVPTTSGWKQLGEIRPGDSVYGRDGSAVLVVGLSPVKVGRPCYRVTFDDGDSVITDASHRWKAVNWANRPAGERVVTTQQMFDAGVDTGYGKRWRLPRHNGFDGVEKSLELDPYVFGLWLGDGDSTNATITVAGEDVEEIARLIEHSGYNTTRCNTSPGAASLLYVRGQSSRQADTVVGRLRRLGVLRNKHIPDSFLEASRSQRLALLQGLMDSDGHTTDRGNCTFVQGCLAMARQFKDLATSLGVSASLRKYRDARAKEGWMYKVHFTPDFCAFRLSRKARKCPERGAVKGWWPSISSIEPCDSVPVRCIAVDSDDHLFLVGRGLHLTHNTHHLTSDKLRRAHQTMLANIPKRMAADAWSLEVTTAYQPGENSVAEATMEYAKAIDEGRAKDARIFYFHRQASNEHDLSTEEGARAAVVEASGPFGMFRDIDGIVELWRDPTTDKKFWERVWLNRPVQSSLKAFDLVKFKALAQPREIREGSLIALGFDGSQTNDATALVATHIESGYQWLAGAWECPYGEKDWRVPAKDVDDCVADLFERFNVWRMYADPPYWQDWLSKWQGDYGEKVVIEWWTNRRRQMAMALERYGSAVTEGSITHDGNDLLQRHVGNAYRHELPSRDEENNPLWLIRKERADSPNKIDAAMASVLSWECRCDAVASGVSEDPVFHVELDSILEESIE